MKKVFWNNSMIFATIMLFLTTNCQKEPAWKGPSCSTQPATNVSVTAATLNGKVNAHDSSTTVVFEYGITESYGQEVSYEQNPITGDTITNVYANLSGITGSTTYHFRVKAENSVGFVYGRDIKFTTLSQDSPTANTCEASNITNTTATLNGDLNPNNLSSVATFEYGTTESYGQEVTSEQSPVTGDAIANVSATLTGLTCGTTYHFRIKAENALGIVYGGDMTFSPSQNPTLSTVSVTQITDTTAISGGNITDDTCADITDRGVYWAISPRGLACHCGLHTHDGIGTGSFTSNLTGLKPSTTYYVQAYATNSTGKVKGFGNIISFKTSP